ncbi:MAG: molybdopterin molybdotransferase MoeA [Oscillospiraceae bacterium]|nr:molybdopterin molybdotransferase MoeA [Oscillospiraceae bacterium]
MNTVTEYYEASGLLLKIARTPHTETVSLDKAAGRVLAKPLVALDNVPPFDRSPYDGYALRSDDVRAASSDCPVTLKITEEIAAGAVPSLPVSSGFAAKVLTGAPIPAGTDAVIMYEETSFTDETVTLYAPVKRGANIVLAGEDVKKGQILAEEGTVIDTGLSGTLASLGMAEVLVYKKPLVGIISTGNEVTEPGRPLPAGGIYNSNRYAISAALSCVGCDTKYFGTAHDDVGDISRLIDLALSHCAAVVLTGGVSVGDYDLTPAAMEQSGVDILVKGVNIKPGMACAYGVKDGKLVLGFSGNPASSVTNLCAVALPAFKKLCGIKHPEHQLFDVILAEDFNKKSKATRFLRGRLDLTDGCVKMHIPSEQGNVIISSMIGCNVFAIVPAGSDKLRAGTVLKGFTV